MKFSAKKFGQTILRRREALGLSVRKAAKQAQVSPATFNRVERGQTPSMESYVALLTWLERTAV